MDYSMVDFNKIFKKKMNDVKILEKTNLKEAIPLWIEIVDLMVKFAKSSNCPRELRQKLIYQADTIVTKVKHLQKGHIKSVFDSKLAESSPPISSFKKQTKTDENPSIEDSEDEMLRQLKNLPETPSYIEEEELDQFSEEEPQDLPVDKPSSDRISDDISTKTDQTDQNIPPATASSSIQKPPTTPKGDESEEIITSPESQKKLSDLAEELKKMPSNLKEIKPAPFSGSSLTINSEDSTKQEDLSKFKQKPTFLDRTSSKANLSSSETDPFKQKLNSDQSDSDVSFKISGTTTDPFAPLNDSAPPDNQSKTAQQHDSPDPFGPSEIELDNDSTEKQTCFACGSELKPNDPICPLCGSDNS